MELLWSFPEWEAGEGGAGRFLTSALKRVDKASGSAQAGPSDVVVRMQAAALSGRDLADVAGRVKSKGSGVGGSEGVGVVEAVGSSVSSLKVGDQVYAYGAEIGTWASTAVVDQTKTFRLAGASSLPAEQAAVLSGVLTAHLNLGVDSVQNQNLDVVLVSGAPRGATLAAVQLAALRGLRPVAVIPDSPVHKEAVYLLKENGALAAVSDSYAASYEFRRLLADLPAPALALDFSGGAATTELLRLLGPGGELVHCAGEPFQVPSSALTSKSLTIRGFSLEHWLDAAEAGEAEAAVSSAAELVASGKVAPPIEVHPLSGFNEALARQADPERLRKLVLEVGK